MKKTSLWYGLYALIVVVVFLALMVWFSKELSYTLKIWSEPIRLGDAAAIDLRTLGSNTYVALDGVPVEGGEVQFKEGIKWFSLGDTVSRMFSLTGQPHVLVRFKESSDQNGSSLKGLSHFEGRLVARDELIGSGYDAILTYYDCLDLHSPTRCNHCLQRSSFNDCREFFTCIARNKAEDCDTLLTLQKTKVEAKNQRMQQLLRDQRLEVAFVHLKELEERIARIKNNPNLKEEEKKKISELESRILELNLQELKARAAAALNRVRSLSDAERELIEKALDEIKELRAEQKALNARQKSLIEGIDSKKTIDTLENEDMAAAKDRIAKLNAIPGVREMEAAKAISKLKKTISTGKDSSEVSQEISRITLLLAEKNLYLYSFAETPEEMARLEKIVTSAVVKGLEDELSEISSRFEKDWVLFDQETPSKKMWVLIVYAVLLAMTVINARKVWRVYSAWKQH